MAFFSDRPTHRYLLEDQLRGPSDVEAYVHALLRGCRCVEIDCWDGDDGEPVVYHGYTLTSKITFKAVVETIAKYAFRTSHAPLILSLENHCSLPQQVVMAKYLKQAFGSTLVTTVDESLAHFPSPAALARRVLIKAKKQAASHAGPDPADGENDDEAYSALEEAKAAKALKKQPRIVRKQLQAASEHAAHRPDEFAPELSNLVSYLASRKFSGFHPDPSEAPYVGVSSFPESRIEI
jgi:phosphatidylinositol phospholipase C delta